MLRRDVAAFGSSRPQARHSATLGAFVPLQLVPFYPPLATVWPIERRPSPVSPATGSASFVVKLTNRMRLDVTQILAFPSSSGAPAPIPPAAGTNVSMSHVLSALSRALDLTEGQPLGHSIRACVIGMRLGQEIGLSDEQLAELYYALLLKDAGCSRRGQMIANG